MTQQPVCQAKSTRAMALFWTTLAFFGGFASVAAFGPVMSKFRVSMNMGPFLAGVLIASPALTGSLLRVPLGALVDRMGGKKPILMLLSLAAAGVAGITVLFRFFPQPGPQHYPYFVLSGILCGCGIAVFSVGVPTVSYWYPQRSQGSALALYGGLGNLAPGIFALLLPFLVMTLGFTASYMLWLGLLLLLIGLIAAFMHDAPYFQYRQLGIEIDPQALLHACGEELLPSGRAMQSIRKAGGDWRTWILTYFYFVSFGGFIALTVWLPTYWVEYFGVSLVRAGALTALYSLAASLLRVAGGYVADRLGGEKVTISALSVICLGALLMVAVGQSFVLAFSGQMLLALGMGFANAAVFKLVPKYSPSAVGGAAGIVGGLGAFGGFVIPPFMGLFIQLGGVAGYSRGFWVFVILAAAGLPLFLLMSLQAAPVKAPGAKQS